MSIVAAAYNTFLTGVDLGVHPLVVVADDRCKGDVYAFLYRPSRPSREGEVAEAYGVLLFPAGYCLGLDPLAEAGNDYALDLTPRRYLRSLLKSMIVWFDSPAAALDRLASGRWGWGLSGRLITFRDFRDRVADCVGLPRPRRDLGVCSVLWQLVEYSPFEGAQGIYHLTPELAKYCEQLPRGARANFCRVQNPNKFGHKYFHTDYKEGVREDHDLILDVLTSRLAEVCEAASMLFGESWRELKRYSAPMMGCLIHSADIASGRVQFVEECAWCCEDREENEQCACNNQQEVPNGGDKDDDQHTGSIEPLPSMRAASGDQAGSESIGYAPDCVLFAEVCAGSDRGTQKFTPCLLETLGDTILDSFVEGLSHVDAEALCDGDCEVDRCSQDLACFLDCDLAVSGCLGDDSDEGEGFADREFGEKIKESHM